MEADKSQDSCSNFVKQYLKECISEFKKIQEIERIGYIWHIKEKVKLQFRCIDEDGKVVTYLSMFRRYHDLNEVEPYKGQDQTISLEPESSFKSVYDTLNEAEKSQCYLSSFHLCKDNFKKEFTLTINFKFPDYYNPKI